MKKIIFMLIYLSIFISCLIFVVFAANTHLANGNMFFDQGMEKYSAKVYFGDDFRKAIEEYDEATSEAPNLKEAWFNKGLAYIRLNTSSSKIGDASRAVYCFKKILDIDPKNAEAQFMIGHAYIVIVCSAYGSSFHPPEYTEAKSKALEALNRVIKEFPESEWVEEAKMVIEGLSQDRARSYKIYPRKELSQEAESEAKEKFETVPQKVIYDKNWEITTTQHESDYFSIKNATGDVIEKVFLKISPKVKDYKMPKGGWLRGCAGFEIEWTYGKEQEKLTLNVPQGDPSNTRPVEIGKEFEVFNYEHLRVVIIPVDYEINETGWYSTFTWQVIAEQK